MRMSRWLHAMAIIAMAVSVADGQPTPLEDEDEEEEPPVQGAVVVTPAGVSPVESSDIPSWRAPPPRFAVAKFKNEGDVRAFDWLVAGAPFEIVEKTEEVFGLEPTGGVLAVTPDVVEDEPGPVLAFAQKRDARWVITGWFDRTNWQLRLGITLWTVNGPTAVVAAETQRTGELKDYHRLLGEALGEAWQGAGFVVDPAKQARLDRALATDVYSVNLMGRGLGHLTAALGPINAKAAQHDLERAVFIDPKNYEAQRLIGELYYHIVVTDPKADPRLAQRAAGKLNYAHDLAPDDIASTRGAAVAAWRNDKHELARELWTQVVTKKPWDLDARYYLGAALWELGEMDAAEKQLEQVTAKAPDNLPARRVLVLIHASRGDSSRLVTELEAIAKQLPEDLAVKNDLAVAYGAVNRWRDGVKLLEEIVGARPTDMPLHARIGDAYVRLGEVDTAVGWYTRAQRLAPDSSFPSFMAAQALYDAGRIDEAHRAYTNAQKFKSYLAASDQALAVIALKKNNRSEAAWYARRAVRGSPRSIISWRTLVVAELTRKDPTAALTALEQALGGWPTDGKLLYLAGVAHATVGNKVAAAERLQQAVDAAPYLVAAKSALATVTAGGTVALDYPLELVRPWGDAVAISEALVRYGQLQTSLSAVRAGYQQQVLTILGALGKGPNAPVKLPAAKRCPLVTIASRWSQAQQELRRYEKIGEELEQTYKFIGRHDDLGATGGLLPGAKRDALEARAAMKTALADISELRAEWTRGLGPELKVAGCTDKLLAAAVLDPERYRVVEEDRLIELPESTPPRPKPRATFYVDNTRCADPVDVWIDGTLLGQVAPGRRSALVADSGERALCLIIPGAAQCGERGTVRQAYLHDGWSTTLYCPK